MYMRKPIKRTGKAKSKKLVAMEAVRRRKRRTYQNLSHSTLVNKLVLADDLEKARKEDK